MNDCPNSHMEVENALIRLREATAEINRATDDVRMKSTLERTWMLQDRLAFANQRLDAASKNRIRSFGHVQLCGTLHVCWSTKDDVGGRYMICLLYRDVVCLASPAKVEQVYTIQACINLSGVTVEEVDNGRGKLPALRQLACSTGTACLTTVQVFNAIQHPSRGNLFSNATSKCTRSS